MSQKQPTRRRMLALASATAVGGLAGCSERLDAVLGSGDGNGGSESSGDSNNGSKAAALKEGAIQQHETEYNSREQYGQPGESFDDFSDLEEWEILEGNGEPDTDIVFDGDQSLKLQGAGNIRARRNVRGEDFRETDFSFAIRTTTPDSMAINLVVESETGSSKTYSIRDIEIEVSEYAEPGWFRISPGVYQQSDYAPDLEYPKYIEIQVLHSMDEAEIWVDDLRTHPTADKGYVILSWDDGFMDWYNTASEMHDEYGFKSVQAIVPSWVTQGKANVVGLNELEERQAEGDQIVCHGTHSRLHGIESEEQLVQRLSEDKRFFESYEFEGGHYIVYPFNSFDSRVLEHAPDYYYAGGFNQAGDVNTTSVYGFDPLALPRTIGSNLDIAKRCVNRAAEHNHCTILNFHSFEHDPESTMSEDDYEELLEHIANSDVEVIDLDDLWEMRTAQHY